MVQPQQQSVPCTVAPHRTPLPWPLPCPNTSVRCRQHWLAGRIWTTGSRCLCQPLQRRGVAIKLFSGTMRSGSTPIEKSADHQTSRQEPDPYRCRRGSHATSHTVPLHIADGIWSVVAHGSQDLALSSGQARAQQDAARKPHTSRRRRSFHRLTGTFAHPVTSVLQSASHRAVPA